MIELRITLLLAKKARIHSHRTMMYIRRCQVNSMKYQRIGLYVCPKAKGSTSRHSSTNLNSQQNSPTSNVYEVKLQRMNQLHHEINDLVNKHTKRKRQEQSVSLGEKFYSFFKTNKAAFINVAIGFIGTIMAIQVAASRGSARQLEKDVKEKENEIKEKRELLKSLVADEFVLSLVRQIQKSETTNSSPGKTTNNTNFLGWYVPSKSESEHSSESLKSIIQESLRQQIGAAALSEDEKRALAIAQLHNSSPMIQNEQTSDIIEVRDISTGQQLIKARKFSM
jgi:hypothetical protein